MSNHFRLSKQKWNPGCANCRGEVESGQRYCSSDCEDSCAFCGKPAVLINPNPTGKPNFCSKFCMKRWRAQRDRLVYPSESDECEIGTCARKHAKNVRLCLGHVNAERRARQLPEAVECVICAAVFVPKNGEGACSEACVQEARRELGQKRRAREVEAFVAAVNRAEIFTRDANTCQLCDEPIDLTVPAPDPLSPSIDHVIPLAAGGTHEPGNVQAAHFGCNSAKGARVR